VRAHFPLVRDEVRSRLLHFRRRHLRTLRRRVLQRPSVRAAPLFEVALPRGAVVAEDDAAAGFLGEPGGEIRDDQGGLVVGIDWVGGFGYGLVRHGRVTPIVAKPPAVTAARGHFVGDHVLLSASENSSVTSRSGVRVSRAFSPITRSADQIGER